MVGALRRRTFEHHLAIIERSGIEGRGTLVDVGCGEGFLLRVAHERGWSALYGVDVSPAAGTEAAGLATIHHGLLSTAPFPAGIADVVTFFDSFEHIWDPLPELLAARRLLKPRGILYLVTPDAGGLFARVMGRRWFQIKPDEHLRLYTRGALRAALAPAGWNAISFRQGWKHTTMAFVTTILGTTNPALARVLRGTLGWNPIWRRVLPLPSGDLVVLGMQGASAGAVRERSETA
jgi:SAM-dependent methyltransferase